MKFIFAFALVCLSAVTAVPVGPQGQQGQQGGPQGQLPGQQQNGQQPGFPGQQNQFPGQPQGPQGQQGQSNTDNTLVNTLEQKASEVLNKAQQTHANSNPLIDRETIQIEALATDLEIQSHKPAGQNSASQKHKVNVLESELLELENTVNEQIDQLQQKGKGPQQNGQPQAQQPNFPQQNGQQPNFPQQNGQQPNFPQQNGQQPNFPQQNGPQAGPQQHL